MRRPPQPSAVVPDQRAPGLETSPSLYEALEALSNDNIEDVKLGQFEEAEGELDGKGLPNTNLGVRRLLL